MVAALFRLCFVSFIFMFSTPVCYALGDTLTVAYPADAKTLDPQVTQDSASHNAMRQIYESLVALDEKENIIPMLAERWDNLEGNKGYIFYLKKGVKFHNGEPLTADDVFFTFKRATSPEGAAVHSFSNFIDAEKMQVIDEYTIKVPTKQPMGSAFLASMNHPWSSILNRKAVESAGKSYGVSPVGTGKFKLASWAKGDSITMKRFEGYHGEKAKIKDLVIRAVLEGTSRTIEAESGAVDIANEIPVVDVERINESADLMIVRRPGLVVVTVGPDITKPPYNDIRVRQAMNMAIDRKGIAKAVFRGYAQPSNGPVSSQVKYNKHDKTPIPEVNIQKAKELLKEAGYPNGFKGVLLSPDRSDRVATMTVVQENLRAIGLDMELQVHEFGAYMDVIRQPGHGPNIWYNWGGAPAADPFFFLTLAFHSSGIGQTNRTFLNDPKIDALLEKGAALNDGPERQAVYEELWDSLNEIIPWLNVIEPDRIYSANKKLRGVNFTAAGITDYTNAYFEK